MTIEEVRHMIEVIYRESGKNNLSVLNCLLENIGRNPNISIDEFILLVRKLPSLLYPVYDLIRSVRHRTLGEKRWIEIGKMRELPANNKFLFMNKMYGTNINVAKFNQLQQTKAKTKNLRLLNDSNSDLSIATSTASRIRSSFAFTGMAVSNTNTRDENWGGLGSGIWGNAPIHKRRSTVAVMDSSPSATPIRLNNTLSSPYKGSGSQSMYDLTPGPISAIHSISKENMMNNNHNNNHNNIHDDNNNSNNNNDDDNNNNDKNNNDGDNKYMSYSMR